MDFEWDPRKAQDNERKHGVSFIEASEVFSDERSSSVPDPDHSRDENRCLLFGVTKGGRYVVVSFTERQGRFRLISARHMTPRERKAYEQ